MQIKALYHIIDLVEKQLGLKPQLLNLIVWMERIQARMQFHQLKNIEDYWQILSQSPHELQELIELMVNTETWFFRDEQVFTFLNYLINQADVLQVTYLKVLSLACSTGEEPYSIVMTLLDAELVENTFQVDAIDISRQALIKAWRGIYHPHSFRNKDIDFRQHYFNKIGSSYKIKRKVKEHTRFYQGNILQDYLPFTSYSYQIIFCRNILIYLHPQAQQQLLNQIKHLLSPQGILIVGVAETKIVLHAGFVPISFVNVYAFQLPLRSQL